MTSEILTLERKARETEMAAIQARNALTRARSTCQHDWSAVKYDPIVQEAYTYPGDPPNTMGVDWRGSVYVPRSETPRWSRTCEKCGTVEYNQSVKEEVTKVPVFNPTRRW